MVKQINLTALSSHWGTVEDSVFLGEWCKHACQEDKWSLYNQEVVSRHWNSMSAVKQGIGYSLEMAKKARLKLADFLRNEYDLDLPDRFFEVMLTCWTSIFTAALYTRYISVKEAVAAYPESCFITCPTTPIWPPVHSPYNWNVDSVFSDEYNLFLFSQIIEALGLNYQERSLTFAASPFKFDREAYSYKRKLMLKAGYFINNLLGREYYNASCLYADNTAKQLFFGTWGKILEDGGADFPKISPHIDYDLRSKTLDLGEDEFPQLLGKVLLSNLPWGLLEGMPKYIQHASKHPARHAKAFITAVGLWGELPWMYVAALSNAPVGIICHGGNTRLVGDDVCIVRETEIQMADLIFPSDRASDYAIPNPALYRVKAQLDKEGIPLAPPSGILYAAAADSRYIRPHGLFNSFLKKYFERQKTLLTLINPEIPVTHRRHSLPIEVGGVDYHHFPSLRRNIIMQRTSDKPFYKAVNEARIVVSDACWVSLAAIEVLVANRPCVLLWHSDIMPTSPLMLEITKVMSDAGIIHTDVKSAAAQINLVYNDPFTWWNSEKVQAARKLFIDNFAIMTDGWPRKWAEVLAKFKIDCSAIPKR